MSDASNQGGYDPFRIDAVAEIDQILLDIIKQGSLVRMHAGDPNHSVITTLISIDFDNERLIIDSAAQEATNRQLIESGKAYFATQINQVNIEFSSGPIHASTYEGRPALTGPIPQYLRRIQRRDSFRVQPSATKPAICTLNLKGETLVLPVFDISAGGVSLLDSDHLIEAYDLPKGHVFKDSILELPGVGQIMLDLKLVRQQTQGTASGKKIARYGYAFFSFKAADRIRVQNYIDQEERHRIAKDRGLA